MSEKRIIGCLVLVTLLPWAVAHAAGSLWSNEHLLDGPRLAVRDTVCITIPQAHVDAGSRSPGNDTGSAGNPTTRLSARVVKVLPNGNVSLQARVSIGTASLLLAGEASRRDISATRTIALDRLSNLAAVSRGMPRALMTRIAAVVPAARVASGPARDESTGSAASLKKEESQ